MKTRISATWLLVPVLVLGPLASGFGQGQTNSSDFSQSDTNTAPAAALSQADPVPGGTPAVVRAEDLAETGQVQLSPWANELAKMARAGVETKVVLAYINTAGTFNLGPEQLVHLRDLGLSNEAINAALQHDGEIASGQRFVTASTVPVAAPVFPKSFLASPITPSAKAVSTAGASGPAEEDTIITQLPDLDESTIATLLPERIWPGLFSWFDEPYNAPARSTRQYPVREPYPVKLTEPVLVLDAAAREPNLQVIQGLP